MKVYKVIFARNEVVMCTESTVRLPNDLEIRYEQNNGQLIYAFVNAADMSEAISKVQQLIPRFATQLVQSRLTDPSAGG
ncbi:MAG: hypothetical protein K0R82_2251 [Flavipsychrobacter sp.]|jgi:hypothetical protein|nr:hypothetical protein [Flavipsychrobacter sp.]